MADLKTIEDLTNAFGPSGFEEEVVKAVQKHCEGLNLRNDAMYNVYATMPDAKGNRPVFMLDAHTDECGFMVQNVEDNGLLSIITLGGFHMTSLPAHSVIVRNSKGEKIKGIITSKPVHFLTAAQKADNSLTIEELKVDVGASSRQEIEEDYGIHVGDPIMPDVTFSYDEKHGICSGKAFDNRLGCVCIIETMKAQMGAVDLAGVDGGALVHGAVLNEAVRTDDTACADDGLAAQDGAGQDGGTRRDDDALVDLYSAALDVHAVGDVVQQDILPLCLSGGQPGAGGLTCRIGNGFHE